MGSAGRHSARAARRHDGSTRGNHARSPAGRGGNSGTSHCIKGHGLPAKALLPRSALTGVLQQPVPGVGAQGARVEELAVAHCCARRRLLRRLLLRQRRLAAGRGAGAGAVAAGAAHYGQLQRAVLLCSQGPVGGRRLQHAGFGGRYRRLRLPAVQLCCCRRGRRGQLQRWQRQLEAGSGRRQLGSAADARHAGRRSVRHRQRQWGGDARPRAAAPLVALAGAAARRRGAGGLASGGRCWLLGRRRWLVDGRRAIRAQQLLNEAAVLLQLLLQRALRLLVSAGREGALSSVRQSRLVGPGRQA